LPDEVLEAVIALLMRCEREGNWPLAVRLVVVVLLSKSDGGFRPIGLLALLPRIWMRARRDAAQDWERMNARSYLYAGAAKGATVAAWKQAARAELAAALGTSYGQVLLDLVKAFERIPHWVLVREARRLGYPLWLIRLSLATYRLERVLRVGRAISDPIRATRGITAGSGLATTEMRLVMVNIVDQATRAYPSVTPTLFVDDLSAESVAPEGHIKQHLIGFVRMVCGRIASDGMEASATKSVCAASSVRLGQELAESLSEFGVRFAMRNKSLGVGLGSGVCRNAKVINVRLKRFRQRLGRYRLLKKARVDTSRVLRTGGVAALTFGQVTTGTPPSTLLQQRRAVTVAAAPSAGASGQNLDLALMLADGSATGRVDPAFDAHAGPIGHWAQAVWNGWLPIRHLSQIVVDARVRLAKATHPWRVVYGPAAALLCTATRLKWTVHDAVTIVTDEGRTLRLELDPPVVVVRAVHEAVRRWRWRSIEKSHNSLRSNGLGVRRRDGADLEASELQADYARLEPELAWGIALGHCQPAVAAS
jgi:hypothetical protein